MDKLTKELQEQYKRMIEDDGAMNRARNAERKARLDVQASSKKAEIARINQQKQNIHEDDDELEESMNVNGVLLEILKEIKMIRLSLSQ
jgi:hypothetical protein